MIAHVTHAGIALPTVASDMWAHMVTLTHWIHVNGSRSWPLSRTRHRGDGRPLRGPAAIW